ncbi:MAG: phosphoribosyltransferase family protein [Bacteroidota bacterium]
MHYGPDKADLVEVQTTIPDDEWTTRFACHKVDRADALSPEVARQYSRMKYGDPEATHAIAQGLVSTLLAHVRFREIFPRFQRLYLCSSAFGAIPTAANAIVREVESLLKAAGFALPVEPFKIDRQGGFEMADYARLDRQSRERAMRKRRISLRPELQAALQDQLVLVIDDLRSTGAHERAIQALLQQSGGPAHIVFGYWIAFNHGLRNNSPSVEEKINHSDIRELEDLLPLYQGAARPPYLNARVLKFILMSGNKGKGNLRGFLEKIEEKACLRLYEAALAEDGYFDRAPFVVGFQVLETYCFERGWIKVRASYEVRNRTAGKTVRWNLRYDEESGFSCAESGVSLNKLAGLYSKFKFGDVEAIRYFGKELAEKMIAELTAGGKLLEVFARAKADGAYVYLVAPGIRNVVSASNFLLRELAMRVNVWLAQQHLPTMIVKHLTRLASGRANYAALSAEARDGRAKTTKTIVPASDYAEEAIHVVFVDDVEVTGTTANRARRRSLEAGAQSFSTVLAMRVDPALAVDFPGIEAVLNEVVVGKKLDAELAAVLSHPDYQPVQRMLRLLLHPDHAAGLVAFASNLPDHALQRLYAGVMANDYLWIRPGEAAEEGELGLYGAALRRLRVVLWGRGLVDEGGLLT